MAQACPQANFMRRYAKVALKGLLRGPVYDALLRLVRINLEVDKGARARSVVAMRALPLAHRSLHRDVIQPP